MGTALDAAKKIEVLQAQIEDGRAGSPTEFDHWKTKSWTVLRATMGNDHPLVVEFNGIKYQLSFWGDGTPQSAHDAARANGVKRGINLLRSAITEVELSAPTVGDEEVSEEGDTTVFLVHGHDTASRQTAARVIAQLTGAEPIILAEQPNRGATIIEKLEHHGSGASFAVVLLTADDLGRPRDVKDDRPRARQNVVLEAGYFIGHLGRARVVMLYETGVELPSDLQGLVYLELDVGGAWKYKLGHEMDAAGLPADLRAVK